MYSDKTKTKNFPSIIFILAVVLSILISCSEPSDDGDTDNTDAITDGGLWTWVSGSSNVDSLGIYGTKGIAEARNGPGARLNAVTWLDTNGDLWLFGGDGIDSNDPPLMGPLNDLWRWDGSNWTWISGSNQSYQNGSYGTKGAADATNVPGARSEAISWIDSSGNLWLFGGHGIDSRGDWSWLNDLWRWDGNNWTWISGSNLVKQMGTYGVKGVADEANVPGARFGAVSWIDPEDNFWLFGGNDESNGAYLLNDLWRWDGRNWTWISGSNVAGQNGVYGAKGAADDNNVPGARHEAMSWSDENGKLWLFGGYGFDSAVQSGSINDLWSYDLKIKR